MSPHAEFTSAGAAVAKADGVVNTVNALQSLQASTSVIAAFPLLGPTVSLMLDILEGIHSKKVRNVSPFAVLLC